MNIEWFRIRNLGNNKIITSNYLWLFVIPFLANNIDKLTILLGFKLEITFSIARLFYASLFFAVGTLIYQIRCPALIKEHLNFTDFNSVGKTPQHTVDYLMMSANQYKSKYTINDIKLLIEKFDCSQKCEEKKLVTLKANDRTYQSLYIDSELQANFFWDAYNLINTQFPWAKKLTYFSYAIGIFFLVIASIENIFTALLYFADINT